MSRGLGVEGCAGSVPLAGLNAFWQTALPSRAIAWPVLLKAAVYEGCAPFGGLL